MMGTRTLAGNRGDGPDLSRLPRLLVVMDPLRAIDPTKDSSFAMLLEAQRLGWSSS